LTQVQVQVQVGPNETKLTLFDTTSPDPAGNAGFCAEKNLRRFSNDWSKDIR